MSQATADTITRRVEIENQIEELITLLDTIDPDPDLEEEPDREPSLGATGCWNGTDHSWGWRRPTPASLDEAEEENEHGGDIQDEPHDGELDQREGDDLWGLDNGIGDGDGLEEQAARLLPHADAEPNRAAA